MKSDVLIVAMGGSVCGVDTKSGAWLWKNALPDGGFGEVAIAVEPEVVFASAFGKMVFCLDSKTGQELWRASTQESGRATILVYDERVYVAKSGVVECFTYDGHRVWAQKLPAMDRGSLALGVPGHVVQADDIGEK